MISLNVIEFAMALLYNVGSELRLYLCEAAVVGEARVPGEGNRGEIS